MANCFIIMPISTPETLVPVFNGDKDHFLHVLEHLFIPALKICNLDPIPPIAEGSDLIHAEIIKNLEKADLVLCDASSLNANVFFELGIRTALNKPVSIVRDDNTPKIPFDMTIINHHTYQSAIQLWDIEKQVKGLAKHIKKCMERSAGSNMLWKYFGISTRGSLEAVKGGIGEKVDMLALQVEGLTRKLNENQPSRQLPAVFGFTPKQCERIQCEILDEALKLGLNNTGVSMPDGDGSVRISLPSQADVDKVIHLSDFAAGLGVKPKVHVRPG